MDDEAARKEVGMEPVGPPPVVDEETGAARELYWSIMAGNISPQLFEQLYVSRLYTRPQAPVPSQHAPSQQAPVPSQHAPSEQAPSYRAPSQHATSHGATIPSPLPSPFTNPRTPPRTPPWAYAMPMPMQMQMPPPMQPPMIVNQSPNLREVLGNPLPLAVIGFCIAQMPMSMEFMAWHGAGGYAIATGATSVWFGGVLMIIAGFCEFILGNNFSFVAFTSFGAHYFSFGTTFMPSFNSVGYYTGTQTAAGITTAAVNLPPTFAASFAYYPLSLFFLTGIFVVCSLRTNAVFVLIFFFMNIGFALMAGAFFKLADYDPNGSAQLLTAAGAMFFVATLCGWYLLCSIMFSLMELPIPELPVIDLSTMVPAKQFDSE